MTPYDFLMDFALMSILLFIAQLMRAKLKIVQKFLLPISLLAGFMGLFFGKQFLNIIPFSDSVGSYPYMLFVFLFASLFIGNEGGGSFNFSSYNRLYPIRTLCKKIWHLQRSR